MNTIRMIAIALPMTLLLACGGGSGGSAMVARTPTAMTPPTTNDPNTPPSMIRLETLPAWVITSLAAVRTRFGGTAPTSMTDDQIIMTIQTIATTADFWYFTGARSTGATGFTETITPPTCTSTCSHTLPNVGSLAFSLTDIEDLSLVDDMNLVGFNSETRSVMVDEEVTMIESRSAGRQSDGTQLAFQTYGGWLTNSVFGVERMEITENEVSEVRLAGFSFGDAPGTNPSGTSKAVWRGGFVGHRILNSESFVSGETEIDIDDFTAPNVDIMITNIKDVNGIFSTESDITIEDMTLTNGTFTDNNAVRGTFYGSGHEQVGGVINESGLVGAFGGTRQ